jgi:hypothetical protein
MSPAQIDHVIILLPYKDLLNPPAWLTDNFTISPGGRHLDGRTENKIIIFQDGTYIELVSFINDDPNLRQGHFWGDKDFGFIDFALTGPNFDYAGLRTRLCQLGSLLGVDYALPQDGGRKRPDGQEVRWKVTFPLSQYSSERQHPASRRGEIPFWCQDETPRNLRVDIQPAYTAHPSGVLGIAQITVLVPRKRAEEYVELYSTIMQTQPVRVFDTTRLPLEAPVHVQGLINPWLFVEVPSSDTEARRVKDYGVGVVDLALRVGVEGQVGVARNPINEEGVWIHFLK